MSFRSGDELIGQDGLQGKVISVHADGSIDFRTVSGDTINLDMEDQKEYDRIKDLPISELRHRTRRFLNAPVRRRKAPPKFPTESVIARAVEGELTAEQAVAVLTANMGQSNKDRQRKRKKFFHVIGSKVK